MRLATVEEVRELQLELLKEFDAFCAQNNIIYYAFAGTLLGTVRHGGFIPWDNDIDVAVDRKDYRKMMELLKEDDAHKYFRFLCYENDPEYLWQHGRISAKKTFLQTARGYEKLGLSIDIFPLDSQGNDLEQAKQNLQEAKDCVALRVMAYNKKYKGVDYSITQSQEEKRLYRLFSVPGQDKEEYWVQKHIQLAQKFDAQKDSKYYGCNSNDKYSVVCKREWYREAILLPFENTKIPVPIDYKLILKEYYGDYMKLPPKEKQVGATQMRVYIKD